MDRTTGIARRNDHGATGGNKLTFALVALPLAIFGGLASFALVIDLCLGALADLIG